MTITADISKLKDVTNLANALWPNHNLEELKKEMRGVILDAKAIIALFIEDNNPIGFAQYQLRFDYVEGTKESPVRYLEGIFVDENIASKVLQYCEKDLQKQIELYVLIKSYKPNLYSLGFKFHRIL